MTLDRTVVTDAGDKWLIERNFEYTGLGFAKRAEPGTDGKVVITPGIAADRTPDVLPRRIEFSKVLGDAEHILETTVPAIIDKERSCPICKQAKERIDALAKGEAKVEDLEDANPEEVGLVRGILRTFTDSIPRPGEIFPKLADLKPKKLD